ncbi:MAG: hypothetical protein KAS72_00690 [Phycisphaerales bacterium]|nr:hypothetical protein [Phycisphaerales bacterium]
MTSFAASSLRLLRRLLQGLPDDQFAAAGRAVVLDGLSAVAFTEARISESAALGATYPAAVGARAWAKQQARRDVNEFGRPLTSASADDPRAALATALGMAMSGRRTACFLSGPDITTGSDLLGRAAGSHIPLVVHLACRAQPGHAQAIGTGHEAYHAVADFGCFQLFATSVQEAVDFALIARRVAERALVPGIVAMDGEQTATAAQDVLLPDETLLRSFLGQPSDRIEPPTDAQRMLLGDTRRRVPRMYDLQRPMMLGPLQGPEAWALGAASQRVYFADHVQRFLSEAFDEFAQQTGRRYGPVLEHALDDAQTILVAQGSAVETAIAVADSLREQGSAQVGVLGVRRLRPFPCAIIAERLSRTGVVAVLERLDAPLAGDAPLMRELRAALHARETRTRLVSVPFGMGGLPLRAADLIALVDALKNPDRDRIHLGLNFIRDHSDYPKQQAVIDALRRADGRLGELGLRSDEQPPDVRPNGAVTVAVHRAAGGEHETFAGEAASMIAGVLGCHLRSRPALTWQRFGDPCADTFTCADSPLLDPGDDVPVNIAVIAADAIHPRMEVTQRLVDGGAVLLVSDKASDELWPTLPAKLRDDAANGRVAIHIVQISADCDASHINEALLGGLVSLVNGAMRAPGSITTAKIRSNREEALAELSQSERDRRLDVIDLAFESITRVEAGDMPLPPADDRLREASAPPAVRELTDSDMPVASLPRFWDQVGVLYRDGKVDQLTADPCLAAGAVPPLSSTFRDVSDASAMLPVFDPQSCDGDGRSWTSCPDGSIAPLVISARALLDAGITMASERGKPVDVLGSIAGKIAGRVNRILAAYPDAPTTAGELFRAAFDSLMDKEDGVDPRKATLAPALDAVVNEVGELPVVRTPIFFDEPERASRGTGELFSLLVNPDACKNATAAIDACKGRGLRAATKTPELVHMQRRLWSLWQRLPDTPGTTIERVRTHRDVGPLAAMLLSRHCLLAMASGDGSEACSGARLALRHVMAAAEYHLQPRLQEHLQRIEALQKQLADRIHDVLAGALPEHDLDALAGGLESLGKREVDLAALSGAVGDAVTAGRVDGDRLARLVEVARGLADLHWQLTQGPTGAGRARTGITIASGSVAAWAGVFPHNPFFSPVVIDAGGDAGELARGLIEGQLEQAIAGVRLMRWAEVELDDPHSAARMADSLKRLRYADLTFEERSLCPPMLIIGDSRSLAGQNLSQLIGLLSTDLPIKIVLLSDIGGGADDALRVESLGAYASDERFDIALLALLSRTAFVTQVSPADGAHFAESVLGALAFTGPALVHIHAPSPERHGFAPERLIAQAELAVASRAFPLFTYDPSADGVFGARLDLSANPDVTSRWHTDAGAAITPAHWAVTEARFSDHLRPLTTNDPAPMPITDYLSLSVHDRVATMPVITVDREGERMSLRVAPTLARDVQRRLEFWRTLQELAGVVTPFTEAVREQAQRDVAQAHEDEITTLKREYETKLAELRAQYDAQAAQRVTSGLMALAGYAPVAAQQGEGGAE